MKQLDAVLHVKGESQFVDDRAVPEGLLYAAVLSSPIAHGKISHIAPAKNLEGAVFTADHIPGEKSAILLPMSHYSQPGKCIILGNRLPSLSVKVLNWRVPRHRRLR